MCLFPGDLGGFPMRCRDNQCGTECRRVRRIRGARPRSPSRKGIAGWESRVFRCSRNSRYSQQGRWSIVLDGLAGEGLFVLGIL